MPELLLDLRDPEVPMNSLTPEQLQYIYIEDLAKAQSWTRAPMERYEPPRRALIHAAVLRWLSGGNCGSDTRVRDRCASAASRC